MMVNNGNPNTTYQNDSPLSSSTIFSIINLKKNEKKTPKAMKNWFNAPKVPEI